MGTHGGDGEAGRVRKHVEVFSLLWRAMSPETREYVLQMCATTSYTVVRIAYLSSRRPSSTLVFADRIVSAVYLPINT